MKRYLLIALLLIPVKGSFAQTKTPAAALILSASYKKAAEENKNVLLIFHASWCGWCRKMERSLSDPSCRKLFDDNYVITYLTVLESTEKKQDENEGAEELLKKYGAWDAGIPFWVILDKEGNLLRDGFIKNTEGKPTLIGCPASEKEVAAFTGILKATSRLNDQQLAVIAAVFSKNEIQ